MATSVDEILEAAAKDGSIDLSEWPRVLESVLQKLHDIVYNEFPIPSIPLPAPLPATIDPDVVRSTPPTTSNTHDAGGFGDNEPPPNSQSSTKENDEPMDIAARPPPVPSREVEHAHQPVQPPDSIETPAGTLPPDLLSSYNYSTRLLERDFAHSPPYTIQRLAELVLWPRKHYRFLPAYLRALDRTVSVTSPASVFPLPVINAAVNGGFLASAEMMPAAVTDSLGSDESLGGALLTPIPWLRIGSTMTSNSSANGQDGELHSESTDTIEGPHGTGSIETVSVTVNGVSSMAGGTSHPSPPSPTLSEQSDASSSSSTSLESTDAQLRQQGGVTQGELLRQEQEAGVVPVSQHGPRRAHISDGNAVAVGREMPRDTAADTVMEDHLGEETPHARGPEEIGMEDMGPQQQKPSGVRLDMEAAAGRAKSPPQATEAQSTQERVDNVLAALRGDAEMQEANMDHAGEAGKDPGDVKKKAEKDKDEVIGMEEEEAKDADGDVVVADADGRDVQEEEKKGGAGGLDASEGGMAASQ
ncbi:hypothetical protein LTR62_007107 [Meristemomyces frigidus]|uniref:Uncharacterized protein n=1 Tax=Meristemomyces frigidus TaxID=1508187 RepID=A0AAN7YDV5_9PEZI|nr:hypothetical protein LTR62_007107 [Meristemomyces frigidus]